ncbi:retinoid-inducible serine carboxypeptidase [Platysternon megacephalum]|uniref:Retinoid-inducible serine carboxypeptidase n=1 Tax=Platysternon megacephalum TaxID=55544 RepID=A0A4D9EAD0_9SAUR|nr:retinoid-inducible serine carboxypeptidase [Platysternon megacephalum]
MDTEESCTNLLRQNFKKTLKSACFLYECGNETSKVFCLKYFWAQITETQTELFLLAFSISTIKKKKKAEFYGSITNCQKICYVLGLLAWMNPHEYELLQNPYATHES